MTKNPIICAIDTTNINQANELMELLGNDVGMFKLGLEFFTMFGADGVRYVTKEGEIPLFLDLKFHDIPNTVAGAVRSAVRVCAPKILTIHAVGGADMIKAAVESAADEADKISTDSPLVAAVTVLTSMDKADINAIGCAGEVKDQVLRLAEIALKNGAKACVCSPQEIGILRSNFGADLQLIVPGIRPQNSSFDDQKRVMSPNKAMEFGASYLVIGRPITAAANPKLAAQDILQSISI